MLDSPSPLKTVMKPSLQPSAASLMVPQSVTIPLTKSSDLDFGLRHLRPALQGGGGGGGGLLAKVSVMAATDATGCFSYFQYIKGKG